MTPRATGHAPHQPTWRPGAIAIIATLCLLVIPPAGADDLGADPVPGFDCWIANERRGPITEFIRCIRDRDGVAPGESYPDTSEEVILDRLHQLFHEGRFDLLDNFAVAARHVLRPEDMTSIRIFSYPSLWSWEEQRPQQLVRAILCPEGQVCPVSFGLDLPPLAAKAVLAGQPAEALQRRRSLRHD